MSNNFYADLEGFSKFSQLTDSSHYVDAPADWYVVACDIEGSTKAIEEGRYKDVNMVGAAAIMSVLNIANREQIPYVFGGDGANLLIPPELLTQTQKTLAAVNHKVQSAFNIKLRTGCIPISALYEHNTRIQVAKYQMSQNVSQASFQGNGLGLAEKWLKQGGGSVLACDYTDEDNPDLQGLECRWEPIANRNGHILSLLVQVTAEYESESLSIYNDIISHINSIYTHTDHVPTHTNQMQLSFNISNLSKEAKMRSNQGTAGYILYLLRIYIINFIGVICLHFGIKTGDFDGNHYLSELVSNSDTRKFDEMLRMILDSTHDQKAALELILQERQSRGEITYGIHVSSQALMTCLVFNLSGNHVHFVDGADGGYAMAARQMKNTQQKDQAS